MSKLVYSPTSALIEGSYDGIRNIDQTQNPLYYSVAFTGDGYLYTHGRKFRLFNVSGNTTQGITFSIQDGLAGVYIDSVSIGTGAVIQAITGDGIVNSTTTNGVAALSHAEFLTNEQATSYGSTSQIPIITVNKSGHITAIQNSSAIDTSKVAASLVSDSGNYYPIGVTDSNLQNPVYHTGVYFDNNGVFHANTIYQGASTLAQLYAPLSHTTVYANDTDYGHVLLSDLIDDTLDNTEKTAATPKAVSLALSSAQNYADALVAAQDAMVFAGTIKPDGVITSHNNNLLTTVVDNTTNIDSITYKVGYTFRFTQAGTFNGEQVEVGDMIIAVADKGLNFSMSDWTIIQTNISGALTSANNLDGLLYANNSRSIQSLALSNGVLRYVNSSLQFVNPNTLWRDVQIDGTSIGTNILNLIPSGGISITHDNGNVTVGLSTSTILNAAQALKIKKSDVEFTYAPSTASTLLIGDLLNLRVNQTGGYVLEHGTVTAITNKLGRITTDGYGHVTSVTEVSSLQNPYSLYVRLSTGEILDYSGAAAKVLVFNNGDDITFANSTNESGHIIITPTITHKYRSVQFYPTLTSPSATVLLANNVSTILTLVGGTNVSLSTVADNNDPLPAGTLRIDAQDTWRQVQAYRNASGAFSVASISDSILKFGSDFIWEDDELGIVWTEIDADGRVTYVK